MLDAATGLAAALSAVWLAMHFMRSAATAVEPVRHIFIRKAHVACGFVGLVIAGLVRESCPQISWVVNVSQLMLASMIALLMISYRGKTMPEILSAQQLGDDVIGAMTEDMTDADFREVITKTYEAHLRRMQRISSRIGRARDG